MHRVYVFVVLVALAAPACPIAVGQEAAADRLIDLTIEPDRQPIRFDPWGRSRSAGVYSCAYGETPGPALLGTIRAGALILTRSHPSSGLSGKIFREDDNTLSVGAADVGLGTSAGLDITLLAALSPHNELEVRYFGIDGWDGSQTASDPGGVRFNGFGVAVAGLSERVDYASRVYNVEVNLRPRVAEGIPLIIGFRTLQLHERFELWRLDPLPESLAITTRTNNFLYGFQVGAEPYLLGAGGPLRLEGLLKAGIYANHASQETTSSLPDAAVSAGRNRAAFLGEVGLTVHYRFSRFFGIRGGYELLWIRGVALAPDQSASTNLLLPSAGLNCSANALLQGAAASLEFIF